VNAAENIHSQLGYFDELDRISTVSLYVTVIFTILIASLLLVDFSFNSESHGAFFCVVAGRAFGP